MSRIMNNVQPALAPRAPLAAICRVFIAALSLRRSLSRFSAARFVRSPLFQAVLPDESTVLDEIDRNYTAASEHSTFTCDLPLPPLRLAILLSPSRLSAAIRTGRCSHSRRSPFVKSLRSSSLPCITLITLITLINPQTRL